MLTKLWSNIVVQYQHFRALKFPPHVSSSQSLVLFGVSTNLAHEAPLRKFQGDEVLKVPVKLCGATAILVHGPDGAEERRSKNWADT